MRRWIGFVAVLAMVVLTAGDANAQPKQPRLRIFFDEAGVDEKEKRVDPLSFENPSVAADSARFYLYTEYGNDNEHWSMDLNIALVGDGEFAAWQIYNTFISAPRWNGVGNASGSGGKFIRSINMIGITTPAATNNQAARDGDGHFAADGDQFGTTLLGYIEVTRNLGDVEVFLEVGRGKINPQKNSTPDDVFALGFGDDPVENHRSTRSTHGDARLSPEPTRLALLAVGGLAALRRRHRL